MLKILDQNNQPGRKRNNQNEKKKQKQEGRKRKILAAMARRNKIHTFEENDGETEVAAELGFLKGRS